MKKYFEEIKEEIENLKKEHNILVVEGKKDNNALLRIGFKEQEISPMSRTGVSIYVVIDDLINIARKRIVCILTDTDKKGRELYHKIKEKLDENGVKINSRLRHLLIKENFSHIEGLDTYLENGNKENKERNKTFRH